MATQLQSTVTTQLHSIFNRVTTPAEAIKLAAREIGYDALKTWGKVRSKVAAERLITRAWINVRSAW